MTVGFTGTRQGLSARQRQQLSFVLAWLSVASTERPTFHHGGAVGADEDAANMAAVLMDVVVHRPATSRPDAMMERNDAIVAAADVLVAAPETDREVQRSGTWATVRRARRKGIPVVMLSRGA